MLWRTHRKAESCGGKQRITEGWDGVLPTAAERLGPAHIVFAYMLVMAVFAFDVLLPLGVNVSALYLVPLGFLVLWSSPKQSSVVLLIAGVCTVLTGIGFFLLAHDPWWVALANRTLAISIIGITTLLSLLRKRTEDDIKVLRGLLPICSYCKKIRDDEGYWQQVERYIAARSNAGFSHGVCPDCGFKHFPTAYDQRDQETTAAGLSHSSAT